MKKDTSVVRNFKKIIIGSPVRNCWFKVPFNCGITIEDFPRLVPPVVPSIIEPYENNDEVFIYGTNSDVQVFLSKENVQNRQSITIYCTKENIKHLIGKENKNLNNLKSKIQEDFPEIRNIAIKPFYGDIVEHVKLEEDGNFVTIPTNEPFNGIIIKG